MKSRLSLIFATLVVLLGSMVWLVEDRSSGANRAVPVGVAVPLLASADRVPAERTASVREEPVASQPGPSAPVGASPAVRVVPSPLAPRQSAPAVHGAAEGDSTYVARDGDTVSQLAVALLGSDSKQHRDAVIAADPSLRSNPDRVLTGQSYSITASAPHAAVSEDVDRNQNADDDDDADLADTAPTAPEVAAAPSANGAPTPKADVSGDRGPRLTYVARRGDSVAVLAGDLLGGDTKTNRDAIIAGNVSLQRHPDRLFAGRSYTIMAPDGLAADRRARRPAAPIGQPDADDVLRVGVGRTLRYTARPGDTVSKLAAALLGRDTPANRESIINDNPTLKLDPDHLVAGATYWVTAPLADMVR